MSTIKVNTLTTLDGTGNITFSRPIVGDGGARLLLGDDKYLYENVARYDEKNFKDN